MAAAAPLRRLRPDGVLHVLDRLAIPLVVEGREMVHGAFPLGRDIGVTAFGPARGLGVEKEVARQVLRADRFVGRREEWIGLTTPLLHRVDRRRRGIHDAVSYTHLRAHETPEH